MNKIITENRENLQELIIREAYFKEKIILSSGKESDYYIDARLITLKPQGAFLCAELMLDMVKGDTYDAIGGPTLGADPRVGAIGILSWQAGKPFNNFIIRKTPKAHGKKQQIEGPALEAGSRVILIDDVATTGKAFIESIDVLNALDVKAVKCLCIVDRDEGAKEAVAAKGSELISIFDIREIHK